MNYQIGEGRTALCYEVTQYGDDIVIHIGGGAPHIGSVSMGEKGQVDTHTFLGHQEYFLTEHTAKTLSSALTARIVVTAGVHIDGITKAEIETVLDQNRTAVKALITLLRKGAWTFDED